MNISFFARPYFYGVDLSKSPRPILFRGSSLIRGEQVASYLGGKYNPASGFENDICIHLKPKDLDQVKDGSYVDVIDGTHTIIGQLKKRPKVNVIAYSKISYKFLKSKLENNVVLIPEHHCNFEKIKRERKKVTTAGYIGSPSPLASQVGDKLEKKLKELGFNFKACYFFKNRKDVTDFYQKIDFQVIAFFGYFGDKNPFTHPNKIVNAASFGIPTIAAWKLGYSEFKDNYIPVKSLEELLEEAEKMKKQDYYDKLSGKIAKAAEPYHIEKIAEKYKELTR